MDANPYTHLQLVWFVGFYWGEVPHLQLQGEGHYCKTRFFTFGVGENQTRCWIFFSDFPYTIVHRLGWCHIMTPCRSCFNPWQMPIWVGKKHHLSQKWWWIYHRMFAVFCVGCWRWQQMFVVVVVVVVVVVQYCWSMLMLMEDSYLPGLNWGHDVEISRFSSKTCNILWRWGETVVGSFQDRLASSPDVFPPDGFSNYRSENDRKGSFSPPPPPPPPPQQQQQQQQQQQPQQPQQPQQQQQQQQQKFMRDILGTALVG